MGDIIHIGGLEPRPVVEQFAFEMEKQLRANDHKPGWQKDSYSDLYNVAEQQLNEVYHAMRELGAYTDQSSAVHIQLLENIKKEAADVANFMMMLSDNVNREIAQVKDRAGLT